jgi:ligand-binding sensor domain-containing protein
LTNVYVQTLAVSGTNLFAGTTDGVFLSTNNGASWTAASSGLTYTQITALTASGTNLFAGSYGLGVDRSTNNGTSWTAASSGLTSTFVLALTVSDTNLFAGTYGGVFLSTNNGTNWTPASSGLTNDYIASLAVSGSNLFAGTGLGVDLSTNNGTSWTAASTGLPNNASVQALAVSGTNLFGATSGIDSAGVFLSTDNGTSWTASSTGLIDTYVYTLAASGTDLFAGTHEGVWRRPLSEMVTAVEETNSNERPSEYSLQQNYPNPFNPTTTIEFSIPHAGVVSIEVINTLGQVVGNLVNEELRPGHYRTTWDGSGFSSGIYFYRLRAGSFSETRKFMLLR